MGGVAKADIGELVLIRGLPGSGKSTMAKVLAQVGYEHYEADMFFERDGVYLHVGGRHFMPLITTQEPDCDSF